MLARVDGVGDVNVFGARDYSMRIWLDPDKVAARGLTAGDVVTALAGPERAGRRRRAQPAAGAASRARSRSTCETLGRLTDPRQFGNIVVRTDPDGRVTRVRDIARVELGALDYSANGYLDKRQAVPLLIFQLPGSNALATADRG